MYSFHSAKSLFSAQPYYQPTMPKIQFHGTLKLLWICHYHNTNAGRIFTVSYRLKLVRTLSSPKPRLMQCKAQYTYAPTALANLDMHFRTNWTAIYAVQYIFQLHIHCANHSFYWVYRCIHCTLCRVSADYLQYYNSNWKIRMWTVLSSRI